MGKTLERPLDCKDIQPVNPKGNIPEYSLSLFLSQEELFTLSSSLYLLGPFKGFVLYLMVVS